MIEAPSGVSLFRMDGAALFGDALVPIYNLHHLVDHPFGGYFAAAGEAAVLVGDIRATFRALRCPPPSGLFTWIERADTSAGRAGIVCGAGFLCRR